MEYGLFVAANYPNLTSVSNTTFFDHEGIFASPINFTGTVANKYAVNGVFKTTSAGTLSVQVARGTGNTAIDLNVREGTYIIARPLN